MQKSMACLHACVCVFVCLWDMGQSMEELDEFYFSWWSLMSISHWRVRLYPSQGQLTVWKSWHLGSYSPPQWHCHVVLWWNSGSFWGRALAHVLNYVHMSLPFHSALWEEGAQGESCSAVRKLFLTLSPSWKTLMNVDLSVINAG